MGKLVDDLGKGLDKLSSDFQPSIHFFQHKDELYLLNYLDHNDSFIQHWWWSLACICVCVSVHKY